MGYNARQCGVAQLYNMLPLCGHGFAVEVGARPQLLATFTFNTTIHIPPMASSHLQVCILNKPSSDTPTDCSMLVMLL
jgi:hypothetical protein